MSKRGYGSTTKSIRDINLLASVIPDRIVAIDCDKDADTVHSEIVRVLAERGILK